MDLSSVNTVGPSGDPVPNKLLCGGILWCATIPSESNGKRRSAKDGSST